MDQRRPRQPASRTEPVRGVIPARIARIAACTRSRLPVLASTLVTWDFTVLIDRCSRSEISVLLSPAPTRARTSRSRAVSGYAVEVDAGHRSGAADPVEHRAGHLRGEDRPARGDRAYRVDQLAAAAPLEQEPASTGRDRVQHVGVVVERRHHDDRRRVRDRGQGAGGRQAVEDRHPDVDQRDVDPRVGADGVQELLPVLDRDRDLHVRLGGDHHREPVAHHRLVVDHRDPDRRSSVIHRDADVEDGAAARSLAEVPAAADGADPLLDAEQAGPAAGVRVPARRRRR